MFYFMELPDTKTETLNKAFTCILNRFPHLTEGLHKCTPKDQQSMINSFTVRSLKWSDSSSWLGWGGSRNHVAVEILFPSEGLVIGVL